MREMPTIWRLRKPLPSDHDLRNLCRSTLFKCGPQIRLPTNQQKHQCALDGGPPTVFASRCPKRVAKISRLEEAKKNRLTKFLMLRISRTYFAPTQHRTPYPLRTQKPTKVEANNSFIPRLGTAYENPAGKTRNPRLRHFKVFTDTCHTKEQHFATKAATDPYLPYLPERDLFFMVPSRSIRPNQRAAKFTWPTHSPTAKRLAKPNLESLFFNHSLNEKLALQHGVYSHLDGHGKERESGAPNKT